jgi:5-(carboxyamino)imidazole ribonucleotide synthase
LPLGATAMRGHAAMLNLIGQTPDPADVLRVPEAHLHRYGKAPRPGRKLGHITVCADDAQILAERLAALAALL